MTYSLSGAFNKTSDSFIVSTHFRSLVFRISIPWNGQFPDGLREHIQIPSAGQRSRAPAKGAAFNLPYDSYLFRTAPGFPDAGLPRAERGAYLIEPLPCQDRLRFAHRDFRFIFSLSAILYQYLPVAEKDPQEPWLSQPLCAWILRDHREINPPSIIEFLSIFGLTCEELLEMCANGLQHVVIREIIQRFDRELQQNKTNQFRFLVESRAAPRLTDVSKEVRGEAPYTVLVYLPVVAPSWHVELSLRSATPEEISFDLDSGITTDAKFYLELGRLESDYVVRAGLKGVKGFPPRNPLFRAKLYEEHFSVVFYVRHDKLAERIKVGPSFMPCEVNITP
jgi:hypothetical protein